MADASLYLGDMKIGGSGGSGAATLARMDTLTTSGTWVHPDGASEDKPKIVRVVISGGGGGGGGNNSSTSGSSGSGGQGGTSKFGRAGARGGNGGGGMSNYTSDSRIYTRPGSYGYGGGTEYGITAHNYYSYYTYRYSPSGSSTQQSENTPMVTNGSPYAGGSQGKEGYFGTASSDPSVPPPPNSGVGGAGGGRWGGSGFVTEMLYQVTGPVNVVIGAGGPGGARRGGGNSGGAGGSGVIEVYY